MAEEAGAGFDWEAGPLIRGRLIQLADEEHVLLITMHHIVSDWWSMGVLFKELSTLYGAFVRGEGDPLAELAVQYADYAMWQRKRMEGEVLKEQAVVLEKEPGGCAGVAGVACRSSTVRARLDYAGGVLPVLLNEKLTAGLRELSARHGTTLYMTLLGMGGVAGEIVGPAGCGDRDASGQSWLHRDRESDRAFCEHAGGARGHVGQADCGEVWSA